jgi:hypothetical protein
MFMAIALGSEGRNIDCLRTSGAVNERWMRPNYKKQEVGDGMCHVGVV